ncbi:hypothetical protein [uncultured Rhodoferax sp.]|uniref:hypothetical protein n=1 Tax=uncultured Rhodoferax sp. TaxID=223188 RepID=UPI0025FE7F13|nr:hypothetical protein [uncultured Rhodoferax sp.]
MKTVARLFLTLVGCGAPILAFADCTDVIKLSKTTSEVVQNRDSFESSATAFCKEFKSTSSTSKSANYGLSYKFLAASMGNAAASETDVASKYCSSDSAQTSRSDAYKQYVESISDKAYSAYQACESMKNSDITFTLNSLLSKSIIISVGNSSKKSAPALIAFDTTSGAKCEWKSASPSTDTISLPTGSTARLNCSRTDTNEESAITITEISGTGNSLTIPWAALDSNGLPLDQLGLLSKKIEIATSKFDALSSQLLGSVVAFNSKQCPAGWDEFVPAYGRFVRGIDKSGANIDVDGERQVASPQSDDIKAHSHQYNDIYWSEAWGSVGNKLVGNKGDQDQDNKGYEMSRTTGESGGKETRPKNIALLYCVRK